MRTASSSISICGVDLAARLRDLSFHSIEPVGELFPVLPYASVDLAAQVGDFATHNVELSCRALVLISLLSSITLRAHSCAAVCWCRFCCSAW